jgi:hypothetical protein
LPGRPAEIEITIVTALTPFADRGSTVRGVPAEWRLVAVAGA